MASKTSDIEKIISLYRAYKEELDSNRSWVGSRFGDIAFIGHLLSFSFPLLSPLMGFDASVQGVILFSLPSLALTALGCFSRLSPLNFLSYMVGSFSKSALGYIAAHFFIFAIPVLFNGLT